MTTDNLNSQYQYVLKLDDQRRPEEKRFPEFQDIMKGLPDGLNGERRSGQSPASPNKPETISEMEPITKIEVPRAWAKEVNQAGFGEVAKSVSFTPPDCGGAELALYDRGFPIAQSESDKFRAVLNKDLHVLDPKEIGSLKEQVLGNIGDGSAFEISRAETKMVNGKKVLAVEGDWKDGGKKFYGCFIPKDETMREIQEVYFEGVEPHFSQLRPDALKAINSIKWKD